jgi:hypothetical protein
MEGFSMYNNKINNAEKIKMAQEMIKNLQDYIELSRTEEKLKLANLESEKAFIVDFIRTNVEVL